MDEYPVQMLCEARLKKPTFWDFGGNWILDHYWQHLCLFSGPSRDSRVATTEQAIGGSGTSWACCEGRSSRGSNYS